MTNSVAGPTNIRAGVMLLADNLPGKKVVIRLKYGAFIAENAKFSTIE